MEKNNTEFIEKLVHINRITKVGTKSSWTEKNKINTNAIQNSGKANAKRALPVAAISYFVFLFSAATIPVATPNNIAIINDPAAICIV